MEIPQSQEQIPSNNPERQVSQEVLKMRGIVAAYAEAVEVLRSDGVAIPVEEIEDIDDFALAA